MARLVEVLAELAVPDPSNLQHLTAFGDDLYQRVDSSDLDDDALIGDSARQFAPEFAVLAEAASRAGDPQSERLLREAAAALPELSRLVFLETADVLLSCPHLIGRFARQLATSLAERVERDRVSDGLQAYACLEVLTRLGLTQPAARLRALDLLLSLASDDSADFTERMPRLVGLALERWGEADLEGVLERLAELEEAKVDASFELALLNLRAALEAESIDAVMAGLMDARDRLIAVESMEEARDDATVYRCALDIVTAFAGSVPGAAIDVTDAVEALSAAMSRRMSFSTRPGMGDWAAPRRQAEGEWYALVGTLRHAITPLGRASWLKPVETLELVLAAYQASRSVTAISAEGLHVVLEPTIEAAFVRREGLLAHLKDALDTDQLEQSDRAAAHALLEAVSSTSGSDGGGALGKVWAAAPALAAELGIDATTAADLAQTVEASPDLVARLNRLAETRARSRARSSDPIVDEILARVLDSLANCEDFTDTVREELVELLTEVIRFAADRADVGRSSGGVDVAYLFPPENGKAFTEDCLQRDVTSWLKSSPLRRSTRMEERDVAAGRADVTVTQEHRFTIEVKRELSDVSRHALLAAYGGQAAGYSVAGARISLAMVLDLTDHKHGIPSLKESVWVDEVPITGADPRHVVTVVVRGNRPTPRQLKAK
jgi:hypothetical protein